MTFMYTPPDGMGELIDSYALPSKEEFDSAIDERGYVLLRGVLDAHAIATMRMDMITVLKRQGLIESEEEANVWSGMPIEEFDDNELYALNSYQTFLTSPTTHRVFEQLFGTTVFLGRNAVLRYFVPHDSLHVTAPHQDNFFFPPEWQQRLEFRTAWIPLTAIDRRMGGLALAQNSHKRGLLPHVEYEDVESANVRGVRQRGVETEKLSEPWLTTDYRPGDVIVFHPHTVHAAMPNRSDKIRLSLDTRILPAHAERPIQWNMTIREIREAGLEQVAAYKGRA